MLPTTMKTIEIKESGGPEVLTIGSRPLPKVADSEVLIKVAAAGVNGPDIAQRKGLYPPPKGASDLLGLEVSGEVVACGSTVLTRKVGDTVCALTNGGGYAEYVAVEAGHCLTIPDGVDVMDAAGLPETFFTVWSNFFLNRTVAPGSLFLVHGGAGGIGSTAIQLGAALDLRVFATCSSAENADFCLNLGAEQPINYREEDFVEIVKEAGGADIRCLVVGDKVVAAMKRQGAEGEFRSNLHRGGSASLVKLTPEERKTAVAAANIMGLNVAGVDLLRSERGPLVMEVNSSPGLEGIEKATGKDVAGLIIDFIEKVRLKTRIIVFSRPLKYKVKWKKQILSNWNENQTFKVLNELYHISDYKINREIYRISLGYPIIVRFIGEHYKIHNKVPVIDNVKGINDYYEKIIINIKTKSALTLFIFCRTFYMKSELAEFLDDELYDCVGELLTNCPYLFEIRLNRVSLYHDSFNKYLKSLNLNYQKRKKKTTQIITNSILNNETRFLSRFSYFELENHMKCEIVQKYCSMKQFESIIENVIDFEAIASFYFQVREAINDLFPSDLSIIQYYDLSLIINIVSRDHISTLNQFLYTYSKSLELNGYGVEDITSSDYLYAMFIYLYDNDSTLLFNKTDNDNYITERFVENLESELYEEDTYFNYYSKPFKLKKTIDFYFSDIEHRNDYLKQILTNLYIHKTVNSDLEELSECINIYMDTDDERGIRLLEAFILPYDWQSMNARWVLKNVKKMINSLGSNSDKNDYLTLTLQDYIKKHSHKGSFNLWENILNYIRLAQHQGRKIDLSSISLFWTMYYNRKDYSVISIPNALKVFEDANLITEEKSISVLKEAQNMSEKGIRHILSEYILLHPPEIILMLAKEFDFDELNVEWLKLPESYINLFPERLYNKAAMQLLNYHNYNREIDFKDISNIYKSNKWPEFFNSLKFRRYKIRVLKSEVFISGLKELDIQLLELEEETTNFKSEPLESLKNGILKSENKHLISERKMSISEVAGYMNGNYSALSELDLFDVFENVDLENHMQEILYSAILGKINSINTYGSLYNLVGNISKDDYSIPLFSTGEPAPYTLDPFYKLGNPTLMYENSIFYEGQSYTSEFSEMDKISILGNNKSNNFSFSTYCNRNWIDIYIKMLT